jgi:hypothetical protein
MRPHYELNERFRAYQKKAERLRIIRGAILGTSFIVLAAAGIGALPGPREFAHSQISRLASISNPLSSASALVQSRLDAGHAEVARSEAAAAVNGASFFDMLGSWFSHLFGTPAPTPIAYERTPEVEPAPTPPRPSPAPPPLLAATPTTPTIVKQYITNPVVERIVQKQTPAIFTGPTFTDLAALRSELLATIARSLPPQPAFVPPQVAAGGGTTVIYQSAPAAAQRIDQLDGVTIRNATIIGGSLSGVSRVGGGGIGDNASTTTFFSTLGHFTTGIMDALSSAAATITSLTSTELVATNATTTNFAATNASTTNLTTGSLTLGSGSGVLYSTSGTVTPIANGADGKVLKLSGGVPTWGNDNAGSGGGSSIWATTTDSLGAFLSPASTVLLVGASATSTTGNILEVKGNSLFRGTATAYNTITGPSFTATSTTVASQLPYASSTAISSSYASSTSGFFGNLSIGSLSGFLKATAGGISTALVDLASNVTGTLPVANGGTGSTTLAGILKGNGTSQVATAVGGTDYEFPLTFSSPLSRSTNTISLSTSGDWAGTLGGFSAAQLIAAGFSTTSADAYISQRNLFSTTSSDFFVTQRNFFSTTSADAFVAQRSFFSTSSTNYWKSVTDLFSTTSSNYLLGTYDKGFFFSTTSADAFAAQRNFFSTTSADAFVAQRNFFSTTSSDFWKTQNDFFSTTSANYFLAQNQGASFSTTSANYLLTTVDKGFFFSTTSADYWKLANSFFSTTSANYWASATNFFSTTSADYFASQRNFFSTTSATYFADASTSIAKTYAANSFTATQTFGNASTTNISASYASSTSGFFGNLSIGSLSGFLKATAGVISTALVDLASNVTGTLPVGNGGTGWASLAAGAIPYGNGASAVATTSAGLPGQVLALLNGVPTWTSTTTLSTISGTLGVANGGTGIASYTAGDILYANTPTSLARVASTTSGTVLALVNGIPTWTATSTLSTIGGTLNLSSQVSNTLGVANGGTGATAIGKLQLLATDASGNVISTSTPTAAAFFATSTTLSSVFPYASSTALTAGEFFATNATTTSLSVVTASTTLLYGAQLRTCNSGNVLTWANGQFGCAADATGAGGAFPFTPTTFGSTAANSTSTLIGFTNGIYATASSTIGGGTAASGLTILGNSTSSGALLPGGSYTSNLSAFDLGATGARWNALWAGTLNIGTSTFSLKSDNSSNLGFFTAASGGGTQAMTLTSSGNVGIGTTTPWSMLNANAGLNKFFDVTGTNPLVVLHNSADPLKEASMMNYTSGLYIDSIGAATASNNSIYFRTTNTNSAIASGLTTAMTIASTGNVGIGTTSPTVQLNVVGGLAVQNTGAFPTSGKGIEISAETGTGVDAIQSYNRDTSAWRTLGLWAGTLTFQTNASERMRIDSSGNVGIGTTTPTAKLDISGGYFRMVDNGNISAPSSGKGLELLSSNGSQYIQAYNRDTSAYITLDLWGSTVTTHNQSDERLKTNISPLDATSGLAAILQLRPVAFNWKDAQLDAQKGPQIGLIAQEVQNVFPNLVTAAPATTTVTLANGTTQTVLGALSLNYEGLIVPLIKAVQDIASLGTTFKANLIGWFADATNGIKDFYASIVHSNRVETQELCVGSTCVTEDQFKTAFQNAAAAGAPTVGVGGGAPSGSSALGAQTDATTTTTSETLALNGNDPVQWQLNTPWQDNLGALFTHDGQSETIYSTSTVDVSIAGTTTIDYWAVVPTSQQWLHTTREVVIAVPANDNTAAATSSPPTAEAANDNTPIEALAPTGTAASSTAQ